MRISTEAKQSLIARYQAGESVTDICADTGVPRSTFYTWLKPLHCDYNRLRSCCQPAGVIKMKQKTPKVRTKD